MATAHAGIGPTNGTHSTGGRLLVVANRLPVTVRGHAGGGIRVSRASGGLATGLRSWQERTAAVWIGWPGDVSCFSARQRRDLDRVLTERGLVPVPLTAEHVARYYEGLANEVLWPLCHYLVDRVPIDAADWPAYREANERFADVVVDTWRPGDLVWVHDYQLLLLPAMLRERLPDARIGFFLHIPFPSSEVFRILPWRREILLGMLGADVVGFHTYAYRRHFLTSLLHCAGIEADVDTIPMDGRTVRAGVFPMGIDAEAFDALAAEDQTRAEVERHRGEAGGHRMILGVDRLDYTKGIPRRLLAFERLLERRSDLRPSIRYVQVAVPSREGVDAYRAFRRQVDELVGRVNGAYATPSAVPVHYLHRSVSRRELVALFGAADVMLVTPLRDGMNLVAKEFVASRRDGDGVLVLSEFAGAAAELGDALIVNPYDADALSRVIEQALEMPAAERRSRMQAMRQRVFSHDVHAWADGFLADLAPAPAPPTSAAAAAAPLGEALSQLGHEPVVLLLDYDGTLVPIADTPERAVPDVELLALLRRLAAHRDVCVHIVSGRSRDVMQEWLGGLPIDLWAEHAFWHRSSSDLEWSQATPLPDDWSGKVLPILESFTGSTPGSRIEHKSAALAWHHRLADPGFGERQAHELRLVLGDALSNQPLEVVEGKKVVEVRLRGISKARAARHVREALEGAGTIVAIGDDRTDEDLFAALPESLTIKVGEGPTAARYRLADVPAVLQFLQWIVEGRQVDTPRAGPQLSSPP